MGRVVTSHIRAALALALFFGARVAPAGAQRPDASGPLRLQATPAAAGIQLDGRLSEAGWSSAPAATGFVQREPNPGTEASRATEVRVLFDGRAIYVGARLHDSPDSVAAQLVRRDQSGIYSDWLYVYLDSYDDNRTAFGFGVNPLGVKQDLKITNDDSRDTGWDAVWAAEAHVDSAGWTAEFRIPLSQLRFKTRGAAWGVNFERRIARREEVSYWAPVLPSTSGFVSRFGTLDGVSELAPSRRFEFMPYTAGRVSRLPGDGANPFYHPNELGGSVGADFQYGLGSELTLTGTVNPDFGQVEADPSAVNLTAFELRFPEKRPFFVEGSEIFSLSGLELFYSRRIGRVPQASVPSGARYQNAPDATTVLGAVKLSGKTAGGWSLGFLNAVTGEEEAQYIASDGSARRAVVEPLANHTIGRVIKDFRRGQSAVGVLFTALHRAGSSDPRLAVLRSSSYAGAFDARHRFGGGNHEISGFLAGSLARGSEEGIRLLQRSPGHYFQRPDAEHLEVEEGITSLSGYATQLRVGRIGGGNWRWSFRGNAYSPGLDVNEGGYFYGMDKVGQQLDITYRRYQPGRVFQRWSVNVAEGSEWTFGGEPISKYAYTTSSFQLRNYWSLFLVLQHHPSYLTTSALRGGPALLQQPNTGGSLNVSSDQRKPLVLSATVAGYFDHGAPGRSVPLSLSLGWRPSPRMNLSLAPRVSWGIAPGQYIGQRTVSDQPHYLFGRLDQVTTSLTARLNYTFTPELSLEAYAQPYVSTGQYTRLAEAAAPRARSFDDRIRAFGPGELVFRADSALYRLDLNSDGVLESSLRDPNFNFRQLRSNVVLRWEYRPGSTLFLAWNQGRTSEARDGRYALGRELQGLLDAEGRHVLMLKMSYWFGL